MSHAYITRLIFWKIGDWGSHGMFIRGMVKKGKERERERKVMPGMLLIGIVLPGMEMNEMSCQERLIE